MQVQIAKPCDGIWTILLVPDGWTVQQYETPYYKKCHRYLASNKQICLLQQEHEPRQQQLAFLDKKVNHDLCRNSWLALLHVEQPQHYKAQGKLECKHE